LKPGDEKVATKTPDAETDAQQKQQRFDSLVTRVNGIKGDWERFKGRIERKMVEVFAAHGEKIAEQLELGQEMRPVLESAVSEQVRRELIGATKTQFESSEAEYTAALAGGCSKDINSAREEADALLKKMQVLEKEELRKAKCGGKLNEKEARKMKKLRADLAAIWSALEQWLDTLEQAVVAWEQCHAQGLGDSLPLRLSCPPTAEAPWNAKELNAYAQVAGLVMLRAAQLAIRYKTQREGSGEMSGAEFVEPATLASDLTAHVALVEDEWRAYVSVVSAAEEEGGSKGGGVDDAKYATAKYASLLLPADVRSLSWGYLEKSRIGCADFGTSDADNDKVAVPLEMRGCVQQVEDALTTAHSAVKTFTVHASFLDSSLQRHAQTVVAAATGSVAAPAPATDDEADGQRGAETATAAATAGASVSAASVSAASVSAASVSAASVSAASESAASVSAASVSAASESAVLSAAVGALMQEKDERYFSLDFQLTSSEACTLCNAAKRARRLQLECDTKLCDYVLYLTQPKKKGKESVAERLLREKAESAEMHPWEALCTAGPSSEKQEKQEKQEHSLVGSWHRSECVALVEAACAPHPFEGACTVMDTVVTGMHRIDDLSALAVSIKKMKVLSTVGARVAECSDLVAVVTSARSESLLSLLDDIAEAEDEGEGGGGARLASKWLSSWRALAECGEGAAMGTSLDSAGQAIGDELLQQKSVLSQMPVDSDEQRQRYNALKQSVGVTVEALRVIAGFYTFFAEAGAVSESSDLRFGLLYGLEI
jgi:hypothetical protein